jgi:hypothetical protein
MKNVAFVMCEKKGICFSHSATREILISHIPKEKIANRVSDLYYIQRHNKRVREHSLFTILSSLRHKCRYKFLLQCHPQFSLSPQQQQLWDLPSTMACEGEAFE